MKVGDLVRTPDYGAGIIIDIVDCHWDPTLPGYSSGGSTYKVACEKDYYFFDGSELKLISES